MGTNLYVGNLAYGASEQDLIDLFGQVGEVVSAQVISDRDTGRSRGFAFVQMSSDDDVRNAIEQLNESEFMGRRLLVNEARPRAERSDRAPRRNGGMASRGAEGGRW